MRYFSDGNNLRKMQKKDLMLFVRNNIQIGSSECIFPSFLCVSIVDWFPK